MKVGADAEVILFSAAHEHAEVMQHMLRKTGGAGGGEGQGVVRSPARDDR